MAKTKAEKIAAIELQMTQLENQRKKLIQEKKQQERKDRTKRLCKRMGLFESMLPESIPLTDEQFQTFLEQTILTEYSHSILDGLTEQPSGQPHASPTISEKQDGADEDEEGESDARVRD
ncbi:DUF3847 domain-containing protein [Bacteroides pyogenes]|uniref:DUF3847 domain-containing protein n=1 Tax=Bacteroides pyogenes TaxID=310300 RepID=UPI002FDA7CAD